MARTVQITFDAADPRGLGAFWCEALGYVEQPPPEGFADWEAAMAAWGMSPDRYNAFYAVVDPDGVGPRIFIQQVPEPKTAKNRLHLDLKVGGGRTVPLARRRERVDAEVARLTALGASILYTMDEPDGMAYYAVVLRDPEGNEFCVV